jgi:hypothetical protein
MSTMLRTLLAWTTAFAVFSTPCAIAQQKQPASDPACEQEKLTQNGKLPPTKKSLSGQLAESRGVICPPPIDPEIHASAPGGGAIKVVPPPGEPGGDPTVKPK